MDVANSHYEGVVRESLNAGFCNEILRTHDEPLDAFIMGCKAVATSQKLLYESIAERGPGIPSSSSR